VNAAAGSFGISAIVMAYEEAASLETVVRGIAAELVRLGNPAEIIVIDDGSGDGTGELAERLAEEIQGLRVVHHLENRGLGRVYRTGFSEARLDCVTFFPADGQFPASIIGQYAPRMLDADMVLGYVTDRDRSLFKLFLSSSERFFYKMLFGKFPRFSGIMMFQRSILDSIPLVSTGRGWTVVWELILRAQRAGYRIVNMPNTMMPRMSGASKVANLRTILANVRQMLELWRVLGRLP